MSFKRRVKGWWVICLMAGFGAQPLFAAEPGAVSRAVEVAPPKGWTPEMPLFHDESTTFSREIERVVPREEGAAHAPRPARPAHALGAAVSEAPSVLRRARQARHSASASLKEARVAKAKGSKAEMARPASARRQARLARGADKSATSRTRTAAAKRGPASKAHQTGVRQGVRSASPVRRASAARQPAGGVARSAKTRRAQASAPGPRQRAVPRAGVSAPGPAATTSPSLR